MRDLLVQFALGRDYTVELDESDNILIYSGTPKLCLQAHYDMVCMGRASHPTPTIATYIEDGWLKATESSLGADNGMAIAMMMRLMDEGRELEFLLTSDEEVGLVGANALEFELRSDYMLNLDFEDEAEVCIGCAGGADIVATQKSNYMDGIGECYEISVRGLAGGHSGVDIDKGIPSAIKLLAEYLHHHHITQIVSIDAGERRNSIPANATAIVRSKVALESSTPVEVRLLDRQPSVLRDSRSIVELLHLFGHGVRAMDEELGIPSVSINLAIVQTDSKSITIETSARAMDMQALELLTAETVSLLDRYGFEVSVEDRYPAWRPQTNSFTTLVNEKMIEVYGQSKMTAIHAGLECGVISQKYPHIEFASIGPTIRYPHSTREMVDLASVERTYEVVVGCCEGTTPHIKRE